MSKYTTEVRYICETAYGLTKSRGADSVDEIINGCLEKVFNFDFPIFDENYRGVLERKILKHYYTREIGEETVGLWKLRLNTRLNEIMPYYNKLYRSELLDFNPLYTKNYTKTGNREGTKEDNITGNEYSQNNTLLEEHLESEGNADSHSSTTSWDKYSDTPQGAITNIDNDTYLTNARKNTDEIDGDSHSNNESTVNSSTNSNSNVNKSSNVNGNTTENYLENIVGYDGVNPSKMLLDYRETFLNIDMDIINSLDDLFIQLW